MCVGLLLQFSLTAQESLIRVADTALLKAPWAGGMDACQFGSMDLNNDGVRDLVVFERRGNRLMFFINEGDADEINWRYDPSYRKYFPDLYEWMVLADYDNDGRPDIFTYSPGWAGMRVFRNVGTEFPEFELVVSPYLTSLQGSGYVNIIATNADYPAIVDIDGDGDLDILTFWALGTYIELHTNQSIEKYGHADSLDYEKTDFCWGRVAENEENNVLYLDTCLFNRDETFSKNEGFRHRGATMLVHDFTGNNLPDMLIADVDYPGITLLVNGGSAANSLMVSQDTSFPAEENPVRLFSMPLATYIDVNNDGLKDLLVSPFDPNPFVTENAQSVWLYLNSGSNNQPVFNLHTKSFLQDQMIDLGSGAYPLFYDLNNDGQKDLIVGNYGKYVRSWYIGLTLHSEYVSSLTHYRMQEQNGEQVFVRMSEDLGGLSDLGLRGLVPAAADLDGDGLPDLLVGSENGKLIHLRQTAVDQWEVLSEHFQGISTDQWSAPELFDINEDGNVDLLIGSRNGKIAFYKGVSQDASISFEWQTDFLGQVNVTDFGLSYDGYSTPRFFYSPEQELMLISGSEQGKLFLFDQIRENLDGVFRERSEWEILIDSNLSMIDPGMRSAAWIGQLVSNEKLQLITGNFSGGMELYNAAIAVAPFLKEHNAFSLMVYPNPVSDELYLKLHEDIQNKSLQLKVYNLMGQLFHDMEIKVGQQPVIDVAALKSGMYVLHVHSAERHYTARFIKL